jgi:RNA polymerase sigma-54 factor
MAIKLSQSMKQTQGMMITPQLQQAIKMLTLTHLEMTNVIAKEMTENPMLEELDPNEGASANDPEMDSIENQAKEAKAENFDEKPIFEKDDFDWAKYVEHFNSNSAQSSPSMVSKDPDERMDYENMVSTETSLGDHLFEQIGVENYPEYIFKVADVVINNLSPDGYLEVSKEEIIELLDVKEEEYFEALDIILRLDPIGCGSSSLEDCLLNQSKILGIHSNLLEEIILNHLDKVKNKQFDKIAQSLNKEEDYIRSTIGILKELNPRPGRMVVSEETQYVIPDIFIDKLGKEFVVRVNDDGIPRLKINQLYQKMLSNSNLGDKEAQNYFQEKMKSAFWLLKSIQNRQKTIFRVAKCIVSRQQEFFHKGPMFLKPMILKDVADEIGMHESTVSRVTNNKYMHTPIGVFELKYFFNAGIGGKAGGVDISNEALKIKLKRIIESENPFKPFSDQKLSTLLSQDDIKVARRTVAKYREMLGIESSSKRKQRA